MKILKCLLMIVTAPVVLVLTLFVWLCTGLIWRGCAYYLFPAEWCDFAGYSFFD